MLEGIMVVAVGKIDTPRRATPRVDPELRRARTCYYHIAGKLGVAIADTLVKRGAVELSDNGASVTPSGRTWLSGIGFALENPHGGRRPLCRPCLDWSERRPHLAGTLGAALLERSLSKGLVFVSGSLRKELPPELQDIPFIAKPFVNEEIRDVVLWVENRALQMRPSSASEQDRNRRVH
jgi:hypothetical protein